MRYAFPFLFIVTIISCKNGGKQVNNFDNPQLLKIVDFQDRRSGDSLIRYLDDSDPVYRIHAAFAFASVQDSIYVDRLKELLLNEYIVRVSCPYFSRISKSWKPGEIFHFWHYLFQSNTP